MSDLRRNLGRNRRYGLLGAAQGTANSYLGDSLSVPFALSIGLPASVAAFIGMAPVAGYLLLPGVPSLVRRLSGGLRVIVLGSAIASGARGLLFAALALAVVSGAVPVALAAVIMVAITMTAGSLDNIGSQLQLTWLHLVLGERDRRWAIQVMATAATMAPAGLLVVASVVAGGSVGSFVPLFLVGSGACAAMVVLLSGLPSPARTEIEMSGLDLLRSPLPPIMRPLLLAQSASGLAHGLCPFFGIYGVAVLGMSPAYAVAVAAATTIATFLATPVLARHLISHSASRLLRTSYLVRVIGMGLVLCSLPGAVYAPFSVVGGAVLVAVGNQAGGMATNERLFRTCPGSSALLQQGRLVAYPAASMLVGQALMAVALVGGSGYLPFAALIGAGMVLRTVAMALTRGEDEPVCDDATAGNGPTRATYDEAGDPLMVTGS